MRDSVSTTAFTSNGSSTRYASPPPAQIDSTVGVTSPRAPISTTPPDVDGDIPDDPIPPLEVHADIDTLEEINSVRRELLSFRKLAWPTREAVGVLARGDPDQIREDTEKYYRDVYDHLVQLVDLTETYRDLVSGARDIYLNALSQSTNEVMKVLTVVATIFIPLTFVVGVYGMNFSGGPAAMPELSWPYAYPAVILGMGAVALVMMGYFRRQGYI